ncbi:MAG: nucleotide exchange factor GrpE [Pirellulaceae bacterium]|nr:nucleotide exchange factor GrpE [Pirellulaceae bacterium]
MDNWPDHDEILTRFRGWLDQTRDECETLGEHATDGELLNEPAGLYQLVEQFTALRHDMKLLTKTARGTEERNEATLVSMQAAIEQFRAVEPKEAEAADKAARPLVEALVDLDESLVRGQRVIEQARRRFVAEVSAEMQEARDRLDALYRTQPWWRRLLCRPWHEATRDVYSGNAFETGRGVFDSLLEGYDLIQNRLRRTMQEQSIVRMECVGKPADPNSMTVIEAVNETGRLPGTVVEEVRPGYFWKGKVLRFAEVKAVAGS